MTSIYSYFCVRIKLKPLSSAIFEYKTISEPVENILLKEKGSKFLGYAYPINNEEELKTCLDKIKDEHPKATHHCYAFRLGLNGENYRANDDGEPSGSAGLPIYNQLLANELTQILLIVVRYYGGTKLGVGGLVKTYKESAKITLDEAEIVIKELETQIRIEFPFSLQNVIFTLLNKNEAQIKEFNADEKCSIIASIKKAKESSLVEQFSEIHQAKIKVLD
ncbi:IMPACT family protein [Riemerella anatipestifer]|uniref:IMPACT family member YigZ n=1 Tax=Riemerella anatipestifer TaxID=34085 RepID=A0A1S7DTT3_RIEAN|nr:YigZ family protein [Riemerella anatipestifer]AQY22533.1 IMPACT family member YigZ [Riemerella anatipestifer]MCO4304786.1 YigZ family protein [Riemerella anatipestifer]MCO7353679.1 YigZ family protein [Riemerella anatipestifer]MCQ4040141.1 YigZ family protein [Riemerella anatipestifer]MCT6761749.1 YigZ family protein [Riemerella anatipestifer]